MMYIIYMNTCCKIQFNTKRLELNTKTLFFLYKMDLEDREAARDVKLHLV